MVSSTWESDSTIRFVVQPNRSLTWAQAKQIFLYFSAFCLAIAGAFTLAGFWPVLPFAGAELTALAVCLYLSCSSGRQTEMIWVSGARLEVAKGRGTRERSWVFNPAWVQVRLSQPRARNHPTRLVIRSGGREVHLGHFLNESERKELAQQLQAAIINAN